MLEDREATPAGEMRLDPRQGIGVRTRPVRCGLWGPSAAGMRPSSLHGRIHGVSPQPVPGRRRPGSRLTDHECAHPRRVMRRRRQLSTRTAGRVDQRPGAREPTRSTAAESCFADWRFLVDGMVARQRPEVRLLCRSRSRRRAHASPRLRNRSSNSGSAAKGWLRLDDLPPSVTAARSERARCSSSRRASGPTCRFFA